MTALLALTRADAEALRTALRRGWSAEALARADAAREAARRAPANVWSWPTAPAPTS